jgi:hypothetical protein
MMWIELRELGGLADLDRRILVTDDKVTLSDRAQLRRERTLEPAERDAVRSLAEALERARPMPDYGRMLGRVPSRTILSVELERHTSVSVRPDPAVDQPPPEFWALVRALHRLAAS